MKIAVIIKHPYRDFDWRIDIVDVPEDTKWDDIRTIIEREMLGPFEIIGLTERINFDRKIDLSKLNNDVSNHMA
jgi:hypothetical protein